jgi:flagellar basal-body rod protein FlgB
MFNDSSLMRTQRMLEMGMNAVLRRREVIADNIANVDVPNFKRSELIFESQLKRALDDEKRAKEDNFPELMTHKKHIPFERHMDWEKVRPKTNLDFLTIMRTDGNNVDMEKEMTKAVENQMRYSIMTQTLNHNFKILNIVLRPQ